jgi:hypothetical protein
MTPTKQEIAAYLRLPVAARSAVVDYDATRQPALREQAARAYDETAGHWGDWDEDSRRYKWTLPMSIETAVACSRATRGAA